MFFYSRFPTTKTHNTKPRKKKSYPDCQAEKKLGSTGGFDRRIREGIRVWILLITENKKGEKERVDPSLDYGGEFG